MIAAHTGMIDPGKLPLKSYLRLIAASYLGIVPKGGSNGLRLHSPVQDVAVKAHNIEALTLKGDVGQIIGASLTYLNVLGVVGLYSDVIDIVGSKLKI